MSWLLIEDLKKAAVAAAIATAVALAIAAAIPGAKAAEAVAGQPPVPSLASVLAGPCTSCHGAGGEGSGANTCYSLITPDHGITVAGVYRVGAKGLEEAAGGISPSEASPEFRALEARYALDWYKSITPDTWG